MIVSSDDLTVLPTKVMLAVHHSDLRDSDLRGADRLPDLHVTYGIRNIICDIEDFVVE